MSIICYPEYCRKKVVSCRDIEDDVLSSGVDVGNYKFYSKGTDSIVLVNENLKLALKIRRLDSNVACLKEGLCLLYIESRAGVKVAPRVYNFSNNHLLMEFIDGEKLGEYLRMLCLEGKVEDARKIVLKCIEKASLLDEIGVVHKELSRPFKHIIVGRDGEVYFIDFGRSRVNHPKACNVCSLLSGVLYNKNVCGEELSSILGVKISKEEVRGILRLYKNRVVDADYIVNKLFY